MAKLEFQTVWQDFKQCQRTQCSQDQNHPEQVQERQQLFQTALRNTQALRYASRSAFYTANFVNVITLICMLFSLLKCFHCSKSKVVKEE